jgi:hypothetical protein
MIEKDAESKSESAMSDDQTVTTEIFEDEPYLGVFDYEEVGAKS